MCADEIVKFAPGLKVLMYYNLTQQKKKNVVTNLRDYDCIVTTPHLKLPEPIVQNVKFHRLVVDESHLLEQSGAGTMSGQADALIKYQVRRLSVSSHRPSRSALLRTLPRRPSTCGSSPAHPSPPASIS